MACGYAGLCSRGGAGVWACGYAGLCSRGGAEVWTKKSRTRKARDYREKAFIL